MEDLFCNISKCRTVLNNLAVVTRCYHVFCIEHGRYYFFNNSPQVNCPVCNEVNVKELDVIQAEFNPNDLILGGLLPEKAIGAVLSCIKFWKKQRKFQQEINHAQLENLNKRLHLAKLEYKNNIKEIKQQHDLELAALKSCYEDTLKKMKKLTLDLEKAKKSKQKYQIAYNSALTSRQNLFTRPQSESAENFGLFGDNLSQIRVDGGGMRGVIPAMILAEIEKRVQKPLSDIFHLMAGTSTGGIAVSGLCKKAHPKFSAQDMVQLYLETGLCIFQTSKWRKYCSWIAGAPYCHKNVEVLFDKYFGESTLEDVSTNLLLTSYDIKNCKTFFFKSWKKDRNFIMLKDALAATAAAPMYFTPKHLRVNDLEMVLIDGGVFANNPAACAFVSGIRLFPHEDIILLSIGTGRSKTSISYEQARKLGTIGWVKPLVWLMFSSGLDCVNYQLDQILHDRYIRIQSQLDPGTEDYLDDVTPENLQYLQSVAIKTIKKFNDDLDRFVYLVKTNSNY